MYEEAKQDEGEEVVIELGKKNDHCSLLLDVDRFNRMRRMLPKNR